MHTTKPHLILFITLSFLLVSCSKQTTKPSQKFDPPVNIRTTPPNGTVHSNKSENQDYTDFSKKIVEALSESSEKKFLALHHPDCPIMKSRTQATLQNKWTKEYQLRIKKVEESFDLNKIVFTVKPLIVLEFQVWTLNKKGQKTELVTGFPIARSGSELKLLEYPCFKTK